MPVTIRRSPDSLTRLRREERASVQPTLASRNYVDQVCIQYYGQGLAVFIRLRLIRGVFTSFFATGSVWSAGGGSGALAVVAPLLCMVVASLPAVTSAQIVVGPYSFPDESPFADTAHFHPNPAHMTEQDPLYHWWPPFPPGWPEVQAGDWMLVGYSPETFLANLGMNTLDPCERGVPYHGRELLDFGFTDVLAENGPGPDIVIFDRGHSRNAHEVAVRPHGGSLTHFLFYPYSSRVPTDHPGGPTGLPLVGVEIDLSHYGILPGVPVDLIQLAGDRETIDEPCTHVDPVMAAVLNPVCACEDGNECTWDCDGSGSCVSSPHDPGTPCSVGVCDGEPDPSCVECVEDVHCPSSRPRCDRAANVCVGCTEDAQCEDWNECTLDTCTAEGACENVPVEAGAPCGEGEVCDGAPEPRCVECLEDAQCESQECMVTGCERGRCIARPQERGTSCEGGLCNGSRTEPECVACTAAADCEEPTPFCLASGLCAECRRDDECSKACMDDVVCDDGICRGTRSSPGTPCPGGYCNLGMPPACVPCLVGTHCDDGDPCTRDICEGTCRHERICTDADAGPPAPPMSGGCGCNAASHPTSTAWPWTAAALALWRRRPRRRPR